MIESIGNNESNYIEPSTFKLFLHFPVLPVYHLYFLGTKLLFNFLEKKVDIRVESQQQLLLTISIQMQNDNYDEDCVKKKRIVNGYLKEVLFFFFKIQVQMNLPYIAEEDQNKI